MKRVTEKNEDTGEIEYEGKVDISGSKQGRGIEYSISYIEYYYIFLNKPQI